MNNYLRIHKYFISELELRKVNLLILTINLINSSFSINQSKLVTMYSMLWAI